MRPLSRQLPALRESQSDGIGPTIAQIFVKHQMHRDYHLAVLHRHHILPTGYAMVYQREGPDKYTCSMQVIELEKTFPSSYHLSDGRFVPFEFSLAEPRIKPSDGFFSELSDILHEHGLDHEIGITKALPPEHLWKEELCETGMICTRIDAEDKMSVENCVITQWAFQETSCGLEITAVRACEETPAGHRRIGKYE